MTPDSFALLKSSRKEIKYGLRKYFSYYCTFCNRQNKSLGLTYINNIIDSKLSYERILDLFIEVSVIKKLLSDSNDLYLFNLPSLNLNGNMSSKYLIDLLEEKKTSWLDEEIALLEKKDKADKNSQVLYENFLLSWE